MDGAGSVRRPPGSTDSSLLTVLIADVRGYTPFTVEQGDEAAARLASRFAEIADEVVAAYGGNVIELRGDEALAVFPSARNALRASVALQSSFREVTAGDRSLPLTVGIGLDAGEVIPVKGGYRGGALNLAARLCSIAGSGEVFCSEMVVGLARKTAGIAFVDRGEVQLKGLAERVRVLQVVADDAVPTEVPRFTATHVPTSNLPILSTPFIGREAEIAEVAGMLRREDIRLLTLTGPGGSGKTRLAIRAAEDLLSDFRDGIYFVSFASLADPGLAVSSIVAVLGIKEAGDRPVVQLLIEQLRDGQLLVLLDNFEHLLPAASDLAALLSGCPGLKLLVTSRAVLHLAAEHDYPVAPLALPDLRHLPELDSLARNDAIRLFVERAQAVKPGFTLTAENCTAVAEICARLDGLPLAIELAAARTRLFPPQRLLQRLTSRLTLLTGGARDAPLRQQTLRNTIDWSYSLLSGEEQRLFHRLGVFTGGFTYDAAEAVCNLDGCIDLMEGLTSLVEKSLLREEDPQPGTSEEPRFLMLETMREYATEQLETSGEQDRLRQAHADYFAELTERVNPKLFGAELKESEDVLEREIDNLRAALDWSLQGGDPMVGLRIAAFTSMFWHDRGRVTEGRRWVEALLATGTGSGTSVRARATDGAGMLARAQCDFEHARLRLEEGLRLYRDLGDEFGIGMALAHLGGLARMLGDLDWAAELLEESISRTRQQDENPYLSSALTNLGEVRMLQGDYSRGRAMLDEALGRRREAGDIIAAGLTFIALARVEQLRGEPGKAAACYREALSLLRSANSMPSIVEALEGLAGIPIDGKEPRAARLRGAAAAIRESAGLPPSPTDAGRVDSAAWNEGFAMTVEQALDYALAE